jgi:hypothetical protein
VKFLGTLAGKAIAVAVAIILLLGILQVRSCQQANQRAAQARVDRGQGEAFQNSAGDAINTITGVAGNEQAGADLTRTNEREIRDAKGSTAAVDPAVRDAGLRSLCRRAAYRNSERCRLFLARSP